MFIVMSYLKNKLQEKIRKYLRRKNKVNTKIKTASGATKTQRAEAAGASFAEVLKEKGVEKIAFDRNGYLYHGRIKAFADGLRKGGIQF